MAKKELEQSFICLDNQISQDKKKGLCQQTIAFKIY